ncbi:uncharacterized protein LOC120328985 [Styela clava]
MASKSSDYDVSTISKKPLKLKSDSGKVHKKKKKKKDKKKKLEKVDVKAIQYQDPTSGPAAPKYKTLTPAEEKFKRVQEKRQMDRILKKASKGHKERVEEFNRHLDSLSEHYDIPKVSWTK